MKALIKLYDMANPAFDGSKIPRNVTEAYLKTQGCKLLLSQHLMLGGATHLHRESSSPLLAECDDMLLEGNALFYITNIYTEPGNDFCMAEIEFLDVDKLEGKAKERAALLKSLLTSGVMLPCSVVIDADWDDNGVARKINKILGVDFTLDPGFAGAGTVEVRMQSRKSASRTTRRVFSVQSYSQNFYEPRLRVFKLGINQGFIELKKYYQDFKKVSVADSQLLYLLGRSDCLCLLFSGGIRSIRMADLQQILPGKEKLIYDFITIRTRLTTTANPHEKLRFNNVVLDLATEMSKKLFA